MTAPRPLAVRNDSHAHELRPCTRCSMHFEPTKWQRHIKSRTCLQCTAILAGNAKTDGNRVRNAARTAPLDPSRDFGGEQAKHLREVWR